MTTFDGASQTLTVTGIYQHEPTARPVAGLRRLLPEVTPKQNADGRGGPGQGRRRAPISATLRTGLEKATDPFLVITVQDREQFKGSQAKQINGLLGVLYGLLALAIVIAVLGIINTLALSVVERRREIGMLRAVGMARTQVRRTIYLESMLIAVFGAIVGVGLGLTFGSLFVRTLRDEGLDHISVPCGPVGGDAGAGRAGRRAGRAVAGGPGRPDPAVGGDGRPVSRAGAASRAIG